MEHFWTFCIITSRRTPHEAKRRLEGERKVYRELDLDNAEDVRAVVVQCAVCGVIAEAPADVDTPCSGSKEAANGG